jgi:hypothetical protein
MRTLVDIPDRQLSDLNIICSTKKLPRAEVIRQAIKAYIDVNKAVPPSQAFGLWSQPLADGLAYQDKVRSEW